MVATTIATGDNQTQGPTTATTTPPATTPTATTATTSPQRTPTIALKATEAHTQTQALQMDNKIRKSPVSTAKSKDITKRTAAKEFKQTSPAFPEAENHTGRDQK